ncbi:AraC family transcriptional regulator [Clostridium sp. YIM B02515]|uniref:AraC family transcriptional regulator n=1 Tax=Clostridium rhizosphaerae TaxID=2803861 RepID=A0ABS1T775_9CLOT|nr:AraC family transcriptional regulator [Clostridium rhizosphaerae]MBL4934612.1 AraC family transcriptional regulator [Clostridium rhizosphaerae]
MKIVSAYFIKDDGNLVNTQNDIAINSCGRYELINLKEVKTFRPDGRDDFQLLYIAKGSANFCINGKEQVAKEGAVIIYYPGEDQNYYYNIEDCPIVYWIHFSGFDVIKILEENNLSNGNIFFIGINNSLTLIFDKIIKELQLTRMNYFQICNLFTKELMTLIGRYLIESGSDFHKQNKILEAAIDYFNEDFNKSINIKEYADRCNISCCWFIRSFKNYTGTTPAQYIINIRMDKAKSLLNSKSFTVSEVANIIGYDNPLYFSRIFKKNVGIAPTDYCMLRK